MAGACMGRGDQMAGKTARSEREREREQQTLENNWVGKELY
jgi:hypothetical protein